MLKFHQMTNVFLPFRQDSCQLGAKGEDSAKGVSFFRFFPPVLVELVEVQTITRSLLFICSHKAERQR